MLSTVLWIHSKNRSCARSRKKVHWLFWNLMLFFNFSWKTTMASPHSKQKRSWLELRNGFRRRIEPFLGSANVFKTYEMVREMDTTKGPILLLLFRGGDRSYETWENTKVCLEHMRWDQNSTILHPASSEDRKLVSSNRYTSLISIFLILSILCSSIADRWACILSLLLF